MKQYKEETIKVKPIVQYGKFTITDHGDKLIVNTDNFALCIYKGMLNNRAQEILNCATSGDEDAIKCFLWEYIKGLSEVCETVEMLINK